MAHSEAGEVSIAPLFGGVNGTYLTFPPGISMSAMYLAFSKPYTPLGPEPPTGQNTARKR